MLEVARLIRRNRRKYRKGRKVMLDQTKKKLFSAKNINNINNLKNETPIRKYFNQIVNFPSLPSFRIDSMAHNKNRKCWEFLNLSKL